MRRLRTTMCWLAMASMLNADVWVIAPDGYYLLQLDADGVPITTLAVGVTGHQFMGVPAGPIDPIDPPDPVDPLPPAGDEWGLAALSETEAEKVVGDPNRNETAAKVGIAYVEVGKLVIDGKIPEGALKASLQLVFNAAVGDSKEFWQPWKDKMDDARNAIDWTGAGDAGQGLIDIGIGASRTSSAAIGDWITFFIEVLLPLILSLRDLFDAESAAAIRT